MHSAVLISLRPRKTARMWRTRSCVWQLRSRRHACPAIRSQRRSLPEPPAVRRGDGSLSGGRATAAQDDLHGIQLPSAIRKGKPRWRGFVLRTSSCRSGSGSTGPPNQDKYRAGRIHDGRLGVKQAVVTKAVEDGQPGSEEEDADTPEEDRAPDEPWTPEPRTPPSDAVWSLEGLGGELGPGAACPDEGKAGAGNPDQSAKPRVRKKQGDRTRNRGKTRHGGWRRRPSRSEHACRHRRNEGEGCLEGDSRHCDCHDVGRLDVDGHSRPNDKSPHRHVCRDG